MRFRQLGWGCSTRAALDLCVCLQSGSPMMARLGTLAGDEAGHRPRSMCPITTTRKVERPYSKPHDADAATRKPWAPDGTGSTLDRLHGGKSSYTTLDQDTLPRYP